MRFAPTPQQGWSTAPQAMQVAVAFELPVQAVPAAVQVRFAPVPQQASPTPPQGLQVAAAPFPLQAVPAAVQVSVCAAGLVSAAASGASSRRSGAACKSCPLRQCSVRVAGRPVPQQGSPEAPQ